MKLLTPYVTTIRPAEARDIAHLGKDFYYWTGWTRRLWPWKELRRNDLVYAFDKKSRRIRAVMRLTRFRAFKYKNWNDFSSHVKSATGWAPDKSNHPIASRGYGICFRWKLVEEVNFDPRISRFPQIGWLLLGVGRPGHERESGVRLVPLGTVGKKHVRVTSRTHSMQLGGHDALVRRFLRTFRLRSDSGFGAP